jgi:hypothetical protein
VGVKGRRRRCKHLLDKETILEVERESTVSHSLENSV